MLWASALYRYTARQVIGVPYITNVLVSYILDNYISSLQTKLRHREGTKPTHRLEAMPLDQYIEGAMVNGAVPENTPHAVRDPLECRPRSAWRAPSQQDASCIRRADRV